MTTTRTVLKGESVTFSLNSVEYAVDTSSVTISGAENKDASTFAAPYFDYSMKVTIRQSDDATSLYQLLSDPANLGTILTFSGKTSTTGSTASGSVRLPWNLPDWGGDHNAVWKQDVTMEIIGQPVYTAPSGG